MTVWRVGSKWGNTNLLEIFKKERIVFVGDEFEGRIEEMGKGDLVAITDGKRIAAVGAIQKFTPLAEINDDYAEEFEYIQAAQLQPVFWSEDYPEIDFSYYDGQGKKFHEAGIEYAKDIKHLYQRLTRKMEMNNIQNLLRYKKQIILQGPPGTGKTKLAKELAESFTTSSVKTDSTRLLIDQFFSSHTVVSEENKQRRKLLQEYKDEFFSKYPKDQLRNLTLDKYTFGDKGNDSFSWWLEYGLWDLGGYSGPAQKFKIFKRDGKYLKSGFVGQIENDETAMRVLAAVIQNVADERDLEESVKKLSEGLVLKILNTYHADKYFPVNNKKLLENILKLIGVDDSGMSLFQKSEAVQTFFKAQKEKFAADVTNTEFMHFLFSPKFNLKGKMEVVEDQIISSGDYQLVQFHPSYTYEDFVRGITAKPNDGGTGILYEAENKLLGKLAKDAKEDPDTPYVLIIDEINRANLSSVLGELIYALEYRYDPKDEKGTTVESMYAVEDEENSTQSSRKLQLPPNLYIIGTMNTADRSVGHIDYAIRRRFAFVDVLPKNLKSDLGDSFMGDLFAQVSTLFVKNYDPSKDYNAPSVKLERSENLSEEFSPKDVWLGHSYFIRQSDSDFNLRLEYEIKPILREYVKDGILVGKVGEKSVNDYIDSLSV